MGKKGKEEKANDRSPIASEDAERLALAKQIEGDLPYDRTLYISEVRYLMKHTAETIIEIGKRFLVIHEKEGYGQFARIVEEELGISRRTAFRFMNAALKAEKYPAINLSQLGTSSKVYALIEAPEEELQKLEQMGLFAGKDMDELESMSVKELRDLVHELKDKKEKFVAREVRKLLEEKGHLEKEVSDLRRRHPNDLGTWVTGNRPVLSQLWENFLEQWRWFVANENTMHNDEAQDYLIEFYDRIYADLDSIDQTRYDKTGLRYTRKKK